jgi:protein tyrosine phosphatase (PTP) superfamily phosphohydrolase (DUF442 family)
MVTIFKINFGIGLKSATPTKPNNYKKIDEFVSRSAQPKKNELKWLKDEGVTDVINLRTMYKPEIDFDETKVLKKLKINYHQIPVATKDIKDAAVQKFLEIIKEVRNSNGKRKAHIHCKAGADRTGFFSLIYKTLYNIDTFENNAQEMVKMRHNQGLYPNLIGKAKELLKKIKI